MTDTQTMIWFISTVVIVFLVMAGGVLMAVRSYEPPRRSKGSRGGPDGATSG